MIVINSDFYLDQVNENDIPNLIKYLNDEETYSNLLAIPHPYTKTSGLWWVNHVEEMRLIFNRLYQWTIKDNTGQLIGGIGLLNKYGPDSHKDELGYWLAKPYWGNGVMPIVVRKFVEVGFENWSLSRIEATTFECNKPSQRVLEKVGFKLEGCLRDYHLKQNQLVNAYMFSLIKSDTE